MAYSTGDPFLDGLEARATRFVGAIPSSAGPDRDWLLYALLRASEPEVGLVISRPAIPVTSTRVYFASARALALLGYAALVDLQTAAGGSTFVHAEDIAVVTGHHLHRNSAVFDARFLRADASYRRLRVQAATFLQEDKEYRVEIWSLPGDPVG